MTQRRFGRTWLSLMAILVVIVSLAIIGCDGDDDEANCTDLQGLTFNIPAGTLSAQAATLVFGQCAGNTVPFTLTLADGTVINGTATITSIVGEIEQILVNGVAQDSVDLGGELGVVEVGDTVIIADEVEIEEQDGQTIIRFIRGDLTITFTFAEGDTGSTGTTGSGGTATGTGTDEG